MQELRERVLRGKYRIPFYMSTDCENLLKRFLVLNPAKRGTLEVREDGENVNILFSFLTTLPSSTSARPGNVTTLCLVPPTPPHHRLQHPQYPYICVRPAHALPLLLSGVGNRNYAPSFLCLHQNCLTCYSLCHHPAQCQCLNKNYPSIKQKVLMRTDLFIAVTSAN